MSDATPAPKPSPFQLLPFDRIAGSTRLYLDFLNRPEKVAAYFGPPFEDDRAVRDLAEQVSRRPYARRELVSLLKELADEYGAGVMARSNLQRIGDPNTLVVFAGQQTGLFTGPLYTVYKALATERWARELTELLGRPVVPCFWLSTDDHDFAEVDHVHLPQGDALKTIRYAPQQAPDGDPVGRVVIGPEMEPALAELEASLPATEFKDVVFRELRQCYAEGQRFAAGFGRLWYRLFPQSGLVPVSPCHLAFKRLAQPLFRRALSDDQALFSAYSEASTALARDGYHQQVHKADRQTFLFYQQFKRHSIYHDEQGYVWEGGEAMATEQLLHTLAEHPNYFSPNVLLRPVVQNALFPTIGVTLGPSETAYYAQIGGLHKLLDVPRPIILPRTSVTLLERSVNQRITKHDIVFEDLHCDPDREIARVLRATFPEDLEHKFDAAQRSVTEAFETIRPDLVRFDPTLDKPVRAASMRAGREMNQVAQKAHAAHKRKQEETEAQIRRLALQLFPRGALQERSFNVVYYWARYGPDLLSRLYKELPVGTRSHVIWEL